MTTRQGLVAKGPGLCFLPLEVADLPDHLPRHAQDDGARGDDLILPDEGAGGDAI